MVIVSFVHVAVVQNMHAVRVGWVVLSRRITDS